MAYERKDGDIVIFPESNKQSSNYPDYTGTLYLGGVTYRVALWTRQGNKGQFLSGQAQPAENNQRGYDRQQPAQQRDIYRNPPRQAESFDPQPNDLPFD